MNNPECKMKLERIDLLKLTTPNSAASWQQFGANLSTTLQKEINLNNLLLTFGQQLQQELLLEGIAFAYPHLKLKLSFGKKAKHVTQFNLKLQHKQLGTLKIASTRKLVNHELNLLKFFISKLIYPLKNSLKYQQALEASLQDPLTKLGNKKALTLELSKEIEFSKRHSTPLSLLMIDLDNFKQVNDELGHNAGDIAIRLFANCLKRCLRNSDSAFRYGGDEFTLLLRKTDLAGANKFTLRLKQETKKYFSKLNLKLAKNKQLAVSIGIAISKAEDNYNSLLQRADNELYSAKVKNKAPRLVLHNC